jgi:hypothetical protein
VRESGWLTGGDVLSARGRAGCGAAVARAESGRSWAECGGVRARGKGGLRVLGRDLVQQGEERVFSLFLFTSQFPFPILPLFLLNKIFCEYSKCLENRI